MQAENRPLSDDQANHDDFEAPKKYSKLKHPHDVRLKGIRRNHGSFGSFRDNDIDDEVCENADRSGSESASTLLIETPKKPVVIMRLSTRLKFLNALYMIYFSC